MWHFSNNEWVTHYKSTKIVIGPNAPTNSPLITISRFQTDSSHVIIDEEEYKSLPSLDKIFQYFQSQHCNRSSIINICGGGLTLDVGGFATSVFMRGMRCNYIPTTLLSMVDASVGGKTGVNSEGKNTVGTIKQPEVVFINVDYLKTLERRQLMNGMAEVIKMAFVYDRSFFQWLQKLDKQALLEINNITHIIKESIRLKIEVVEKDVDQKHQRKWLNFGHTIGHALQYMLEPELKHGQCVSIGMVLANKLSIELGILEDQREAMELKELLQKFQLLTKLPGDLNSQRFLNLMLKDKKQINQKDVNFVLVRSIGNPCTSTTQVSTDMLKKLVLNSPISIEHKQQSKQPQLNEQLFPSSKSLTIRYLYGCALKVLSTSKPLTIKNCLFSQDTIAMTDCLKKLGFGMIVVKDEIQISGFKRNNRGLLNVGNSGLTARFILPLCAILGGEYEIRCDKRMEERPNSQIFKLLESFGAKLQYLKVPYCFPIKMHSSPITIPQRVSINGEQSSQFISSILFLSILGKMPIIDVMNKNSQKQLVSQSFIRMTLGVLQQLGAFVNYSSHTFTHDRSKNVETGKSQFTIEPDYAGLSYPYLHRLLTSLPLPNVSYEKSLQGDALFYQYIELLESTNSQTVSLNFNNCTDTFMTMLVYVICRKGKEFTLIITNIYNQRKKESNRIGAMIQNLSKVADVEENQDGVTVRGGVDQDKVRGVGQIVFQSYDDHRIGMSMGVLSSHLSKLFPSTKFIVTDPHSVNKTFPNFWKWMESQNTQLSPVSKKEVSVAKQRLPQSYYLIGMRGCGKSTYAKSLSSQLNLRLMEMDNICTDVINSKHKCQSISELVEKHGWEKFREVETDVLKKIIKEKNVVVATGGGIVDRYINRCILERQECVYIEKRFEDLNLAGSATRPDLLEDLRTVFERREKSYLSLAKTIITLQQSSIQDNTSLFIDQFKRKYLRKPDISGFVLCSGDFSQTSSQGQYDGVEWRLDQLLNRNSLKYIRFKLASQYSRNPLATILTLRTAEQLRGNDKRLYQTLHRQIQKIPTEFVDAQITNIPPNEYVHNPLWSYHGSERKWLQEMKLKQGMKKVILSPQRNYKILEDKYKDCFDLFWTLGIENRGTRLDSKVKMVIAKQGQSNPIGIMAKRQFISLLGLLRKAIK